MTETADASPTKRFFIEIITRDISLEDAILDLVDNSIDSLMRQFKEQEYKSALLRLPEEDTEKEKRYVPRIEISISEHEFSITDACDGIGYERAKNEVFRFGREKDFDHSALSVFGIGLKRAIFKIGRDISIQSMSSEDGFRLHINSDEWSKPKTKWEFPIERLERSNGLRTGTRIVIKRLTPETRSRITHGNAIGNTADAIARSHSLFLNRFVEISVNGQKVVPKKIPIGESKQVNTAHVEATYGQVSVRIIAGLAQRIGGEWLGEQAGWYVLCNGRTVLSSDKTELTGWGVDLPSYHNKFSGFIGIVFFFSSQPENLPWTTTKHSINKDSLVFQKIKNEMIIQARPVLNFLNRMYQAGQPEEPFERSIAQSLATADVRSIAAKPAQTFSVAAAPRKAQSSVSVQYKIKKEELAQARRCIGKPHASASEIGRSAFYYWLEQECADE